MRWSLLLTLLICQTQGNASDFRTSDIGQSCDGLTEREAAIGGEKIPQGANEPGIHTFKAVLYGRDVSVVYLCTDGVLRIGNYFFPEQELDAALKTFREGYDELVATYGPPFLDTTPWQYGASEMNPRFVADTPQRYHANWRTPSVNPWIALTLNGPEKGPNWKVSIVFPRPSAAKKP